MSEEHKYVGQRLPRYDGMQHVTGNTRYVNDIRLPNTCIAKAWRSPLNSALIRNIDISQAEKVPGVIKVITHKDVPHNRYTSSGEYPVLADSEIRYLGQEVVMVAAEDEAAALEAVGRVRVELEEREPVLDPFKAVEPGAPLVDPRGPYLLHGSGNATLIVKGDVEKGFAQSDFIVEHYYRTAAQEQCPLETQVAIAQTDAMGRTHIHSCMQNIFLAQGTIAGILGVSLSRVHIIGGILGGGFGGKNDLCTDHLVAVLSLYTNGRPVKWLWTREEEFLYSTHRPCTHMFFKDGVTRDGKILARQIRSIRDCGAYYLTNDYVITKHAYGVAGPYNIPNVSIDARGVMTNKRPASSMRGFGLYQAAFAYDVQMERIAEVVGIDSWRLRFINALKDGDESSFMVPQHSCAMIEVMQAAAQRAGIKLDADLAAMSSGKVA